MGIGDFLQSIAAGLFVREIAGHLDRLSAHLLAQALTKLSPAQEELAESWKSHFEDCPTSISKLIHAAGCLRIAGTWRLEMSKDEYRRYLHVETCGKTAKVRSHVIRCRAWLVRLLARTPLLGESRKRVMLDAAEKAEKFAVLMQQAGSFYLMGAAMAIRPKRRTQDRRANEFARVIGICGGARLFGALHDQIADCACLRNAFGVKVKYELPEPSSEFKK